MKRADVTGKSRLDRCGAQLQACRNADLGTLRGVSRHWRNPLRRELLATTALAVGLNVALVSGAQAQSKSYVAGHSAMAGTDSATAVGPNASAGGGAVALSQMPLRYSIAGSPTTANPAVPSDDVTLVGATAGRAVALHNVAPGDISSADSTDAVNGGQLFATNQQVAGLAGGTIGLVQQDPTSRTLTIGRSTDGTTVAFADRRGPHARSRASAPAGSPRAARRASMAVSSTA